MNKDCHIYAPQDDDNHLSDRLERLYEQADRLRDERRDRLWEEQIEAKKAIPLTPTLSPAKTDTTL